MCNRDVGEAERTLKQIFADARQQAPSIILIDDAHRLCPHRGQLRGANGKSQQGLAQVGEQHRALISSLLTMIDGADSQKNEGVFIIGRPPHSSLSVAFC